MLSKSHETISGSILSGKSISTNKRGKMVDIIIEKAKQIPLGDLIHLLEQG
jgi:hypothetical protein